MAKKYTIYILETEQKSSERDTMSLDPLNQFSRQEKQLL